MTQQVAIETGEDYINYTFNMEARGVAEVSSELIGLSNTVSNVLGQIAFKTSDFLSHTEMMAIGTGAAISAMFVKASQSAINFQQQIANVKAIGGATIDAQGIGNAAMEYSNKFGMATAQMTEGLEALARAGITSTNVMKQVLGEGVKLSKLEGLDLEDSINDLISTTNLLSEMDVDMNDANYGELVQAMNQHIVSTSESAPINAQNIIQTLQHVGGYASAANIDQDDLFAVIAQLGARGTKGEMAGTALRAFIAAPQKDTAQRALNRIGLNVSDLWDESGEAMLPISEVKDVLDNALEKRGYSKQEKLEFYSDFAGYKQANQIMKINTEEVRKYKEDIANAWDLGTKLNTILGTVRGNLDRIWQISQNFMTKVGSKLLTIAGALLTPIRVFLDIFTRIPFADTVVAGAMIFTAFRGGLLIINKILPLVSSFSTNIFKTAKNSLSIKQQWRGINRELQKFKDNKEAIKRGDYRALNTNIGPTRKEKIQLENMVFAQMWRETQTHQNGNVQNFEDLPLYAQERFKREVRHTQAFEENYESLLDRVNNNIDNAINESIEFKFEDAPYKVVLDSISQYVEYIYRTMSDDGGNRDKNAQANILSNIFKNRVDGNDYGNLEFKYRGENGVNKLKWDIYKNSRDIRQRAKDFDNTDAGNLTQAQINAHLNAWIGASNKGHQKSTDANISEIRMVFEEGRLAHHENPWEGLKDDQIKLMAKAVGLSGYENFDSRQGGDRNIAARDLYQEFQRKYGNKSLSEQRSIIDKFFEEKNDKGETLEKIWQRNFNRPARGPKEVLLQNNDIAKQIAQQLNIQTSIGNETYDVFDYIQANKDNLTDQQKYIIAQTTFLGTKLDNGSTIFQDNQLKFMLEQREMLLNTAKDFDVHADIFGLSDSLKNEVKDVIAAMNADAQTLRIGGEELGRALVEGFIVDGLGRHSPGYMFWAYINERTDINSAILQSKGIFNESAGLLGLEMTNAFDSKLGMNRVFDSGIEYLRRDSDVIQSIISDFNREDFSVYDAQDLIHTDGIIWEQADIQDDLNLTFSEIESLEHFVRPYGFDVSNLERFGKNFGTEWGQEPFRSGLWYAYYDLLNSYVFKYKDLEDRFGHDNISDFNFLAESAFMLNSDSWLNFKTNGNTGDFAMDEDIFNEIAEAVEEKYFDFLYNIGQDMKNVIKRSNGLFENTKIYRGGRLPLTNENLGEYLGFTSTSFSSAMVDQYYGVGAAYNYKTNIFAPEEVLGIYPNVETIGRARLLQDGSSLPSVYNNQLEYTMGSGQPFIELPNENGEFSNKALKQEADILVLTPSQIKKVRDVVVDEMSDIINNGRNVSDILSSDGLKIAQNLHSFKDKGQTSKHKNEEKGWALKVLNNIKEDSINKDTLQNEHALQNEYTSQYEKERQYAQIRADLQRRKYNRDDEKGWASKALNEMKQDSANEHALQNEYTSQYEKERQYAQIRADLQRRKYNRDDEKGWALNVFEGLKNIATNEYLDTDTTSKKGENYYYTDTSHIGKPGYTTERMLDLFSSEWLNIGNILYEEDYLGEAFMNDATINPGAILYAVNNNPDIYSDYGTALLETIVHEGTHILADHIIREADAYKESYEGGIDSFTTDESVFGYNSHFVAEFEANYVAVNTLERLGLEASKKAKERMIAFKELIDEQELENSYNLELLDSLVDNFVEHRVDLWSYVRNASTRFDMVSANTNRMEVADSLRNVKVALGNSTKSSSSYYGGPVKNLYSMNELTGNMALDILSLNPATYGIGDYDELLEKSIIGKYAPIVGFDKARIGYEYASQRATEEKIQDFKYSILDNFNKNDFIKPELNPDYISSDVDINKWRNNNTIKKYMSELYQSNYQDSLSPGTPYETRAYAELLHSKSSLMKDFVDRGIYGYENGWTRYFTDDDGLIDTEIIYIKDAVEHLNNLFEHSPGAYDNQLLYHGGELDTNLFGFGQFNLRSLSYDAKTAANHSETPSRYNQKVYVPAGSSILTPTYNMLQSTWYDEGEATVGVAQPYFELKRKDGDYTQGQNKAEVLLLGPQQQNDFLDSIGLVSLKDKSVKDKNNKEKDWLSYIKPTAGIFGMKELGTVSREGEKDKSFMFFLDTVLPEKIQNITKEKNSISIKEVDDIIKQFIPDIKFAEEYDVFERHATKGLEREKNIFYTPEALKQTKEKNNRSKLCECLRQTIYKHQAERHHNIKRDKYRKQIDFQDIKERTRQHHNIRKEKFNALSKEKERQEKLEELKEKTRKHHNIKKEKYDSFITQQKRNQEIANLRKQIAEDEKRWLEEGKKNAQERKERLQELRNQSANKDTNSREKTTLTRQEILNLRLGLENARKRRQQLKKLQEEQRKLYQEERAKLEAQREQQATTYDEERKKEKERLQEKWNKRQNKDKAPDNRSIWDKIREAIVVGTKSHYYYFGGEKKIADEEGQTSFQKKIQNWGLGATNKAEGYVNSGFNKLSNFNEKYYDEDKKEQVSNRFSQAKNAISSVLEPMKQFNEGLEKAAEIFPPLTIATGALNTAIQIGEGVTWALGVAESFLDAEKTYETLINLPLITSEQAVILAKTLETAATWGLTTAIGALEAVLLPIIVIVAAIIAAVELLKFWEKQHAEALKKSQEELQEATAKNNAALSQYKNLKKAREAETDAIKKQQAARKEAIALYELEASRINKRRAVQEEAKVRNDAIWGEYGLRATMQKMGLGIIAGGDFESQYENYEGTTKNIRRVKEDTLGNLGATQEQQYVASFYDANQMAFAEIDAYKDDLGKLYDVESKLIEKYGSIEDARNSQEFADAVQEFCDATGIQAETAVKYLDWLETENKVNQASKVAEANIKMVRARADAKAAGIDMDNGGFDSENMDDVGRAMVYAEVDQMIKDEKHEMWWTMLWEYLQAIISCLFLNFGEASKHTQKALAYQEGINELEENREQYYQEAMDYYENADRYNYGLGSYSVYADTPFGGAVSSASTQYAEREQQKMFNSTGQVMTEEDYHAVQSQYEEETFGVTSEGIKQQKQKEVQEAQEKQKAEETKKADTTLGQLQNNGEQAHRDALDIIDAIKGQPGIISGLGAGISSLLGGGEGGIGSTLRKRGLKDVFKWMSGEEGTLTGKIAEYISPKLEGAKAAYADEGFGGLYKYGKGVASKGASRIKGGLSSLKSEAVVAKDVYKLTGPKGLLGYGEGALRNGVGAIKNSSIAQKISGRIAGAREINAWSEGLGTDIGRTKFDKMVGLYDSVKGAYAEGSYGGLARFGKEGIKNSLSRGKDAIKGFAEDAPGALSRGKDAFKASYKPGASLGQMKSAFSPKNLAGGVDDIAKGVKGGGSLMKGIGRVGGTALMALGPALAFADKASELNPFEGPHYNEDGTEKKALQATGEVVGTTAGALGGVAGGLEGAAAGAALGTAILPGIGTVVGGVLGGIAGGWLGDTIFQPIGEAIGGTIGWLGDNLLGGIQNVAGTVWDGLTSAAGGVWDAVSNAAGGVWDFLTGGGEGNQPVGGLLGLTPIGMGINAAAGIWDWLSGGNQENDPYANVDNVGKQQPQKSTAKTQNTIVIKNININTEDDPEKIKTALMNLIIEMQEQINPRQVSRTVGEPPAVESATTNQNENNDPLAEGTDTESGTPNGNSNTNTNTNTN